MSAITLNSVKSFSAHQFALWRILFGAYITFYAVRVFPYVTELFSADGIYREPTRLLPFPNVLYTWGNAEIALGLGILGVIGGLAILLGYYRRLGALAAWYVLACFYGWNYLSADPSMAYVGLLLLLLAVIPSGEPLSLDRTRVQRNEKTTPSHTWFFPYWSYMTALVALGVGYSVSGWDKLQATGWQNGDAMYYLNNLCIAHDNWVVQLTNMLPMEAIWLLTWFSAGVMLIALPFLLWPRTRYATWILLTVMFVYITFTHDLLQVSLGMLFFHFFLFDRVWVNPRQVHAPAQLWYDTNCNLCQRYIAFVQTEDHHNPVALKSIYDRADQSVDSLILTIGEKEYLYSDAVLQHWLRFGGLFAVVAYGALCIPKKWRDRVYRFVARNRYRWFGTCDC